ncbi:cobalt-precorrin-5B (C(1))-methyltransferase CbiD [Aedoeadaptatus coxii]|uniref:Cobalt-precorrin-5B C(1)-methyltransferase n=2 Tax=Aedoeadaptatus coxii TaxID=755172 RepID=A0A134AC15_9FIRM|nr:cobalt-precorrin-5B (C(1))-methyltransferase CbiD [Peptoniphilus coxii]KXB65198.1 cobalamin biosynthesis protein CbiD [Peptoniphilus coxii]
MRSTIVDGKSMRMGYTTGTCAVAATQAAITSLESGETVDLVRVQVPAGDVLAIETREISRTHERATYSVIKDSGDDPDITDGMELQVTVEKTEDGKITWRKGMGVGVFTEDSLFGTAGELAINPVPKKEIKKILEEHKGEGIAIEINIPEGEALAKKTFNPRLGIVGGLSILGTSGLVRPMSKDAYVATINMELESLKHLGVKSIVLTPGHYGENYAKKHYENDRVVQVSNYFGDALCLARDKGFQKIIVLGHIGKMAKLAIGIFQTHSAVADGRMESLAYYLFKMNAPREFIESVEKEVTAERALIRCREEGYGDILEVMERGIEERVKRYLKREDMDIHGKIYTMEDLS